MKNKLKKLQLVFYNFRKKGLLFCAVFALTVQGLTAFIPKIGTYADPVNSEEIFEADARITEPVAGANPDFNILSSDDSKYSVSAVYWYEHAEPYPDLTATSTFEAGKDYAVRFVFEAKEGYSFRTDTVFTLNGQTTSSYGTNVNREFIFYDVSEEPLPATRSATTFQVTATSTEELAWDANLTDYINNKRIEWSNTATGQGVDGDYRAAWEALYVADDDVYKYPVYLRTYFTGVTLDETCNGTILIGDPDDIIGGGCAIYNYRVEYEEVTVTKPTHFTVKFDTGPVFPEEYRLVDQRVEAGAAIDEPENADGIKITEIVTEYDGKYYFNDYEIIGLFTDPEFTTEYDNDPIVEDTTLYLKWYDTLEEYDQITEVNLTVTPPEAGTEIAMEDEDDWNSQSPQLDVTIPEDAGYNLWADDEEENYAYWLQEKSFYSDMFTGVIEKGGKYFAEIWLKTNEPDTTIFARNVVVNINGVALTADAIMYDVDSIVVLVEIDIPDDTAAPETGVFTSEGASATIAVFSTIATVVILSSLVAVFVIRRNRE
ncbi:hypothetical protein IKF86_01550 [Candidatus Saccharibacteria bacterium]|nr:hypothetical protein [Candidatus Saccharibacteria bacterium]